MSYGDKSYCTIQHQCHHNVKKAFASASRKEHQHQRSHFHDCVHWSTMKTTMTTTVNLLVFFLLLSFIQGENVNQSNCKAENIFSKKVCFLAFFLHEWFFQVYLLGGKMQFTLWYLLQEGMEVTTDVFKSTDKVLLAGMEPWRNHWRLLCECQENSLRMRHQLMRWCQMMSQNLVAHLVR